VAIGEEENAAECTRENIAAKFSGGFEGDDAVYRYD
jgi:hypothetical protein